MHRIGCGCRLTNKGLCRYDAATDKFIVYPWREFVRKTFPERLPDAYLKIYQIDQRSPQQLATNQHWRLFIRLEARTVCLPSNTQVISNRHLRHELQGGNLFWQLVPKSASL